MAPESDRGIVTAGMDRGIVTAGMHRGTRRGGIGRALLGLAAAQVAFAATFRGPRPRFWQRMTATGVALGGYALAASPSARRVRIGPKDVALGLSSAAVLYVTFWVGDRVARRIVPSGEEDIADIYALRELRPRNEIALRLVSIVAPAEEVFWRGLVQSALMERYGRWPGAALAIAAYGGVHVVTGNFTLFGAATVAGAHWGALYALGVPLGALIVSHAAWDVWIFLLQPTNQPREKSAALS
jgi:membrane protease YdiL (CAAX protease family)